jgi:hypothetical protein
MRSLWRTVLVLALAPSLTVFYALPPEHLHESDSDHPHAVVHRHFEAHDHDSAEFDHGEGRVVWLDAAAIQCATSWTPAPLAFVSVEFERILPRTTWVATSIDDSAPPHGPPRACLSLRAPPLPVNLT